jgi:hypothetical protein
VIGRNASWNSSESSITATADDLLVPAPFLKTRNHKNRNMSVHAKQKKNKKPCKPL